jgi:hypothetical protein
MHIQVIHFNLKGVSEGEYYQLCDELAPTFAKVPGLLAKTWLANPCKNTYGGIYLWESKQAMSAFMQTELFCAVKAHPHLANLTSKDFAVMEGPSHVTRGLTAAMQLA